MSAKEQFNKLGSNLLSLGVRKLSALMFVGLAIFASIGIASYYASKPDFETLYTNLNPQDVSRIGGVLREAGITFDVNAEGTKVLVKRGETSTARMILAEKGLPNSATAGYELFDKLGSMSLTSFMQNITRIRALEGEIARTIQAMKGVKAARVHIVLPDQGSFRRTPQPPSASVVIRTDIANFGSAEAIRRLVASAVPSLQPDQVSVLSTDGTVFAGAGDQADALPGKMLDLEKQVGHNITDNVRKTLVPFLGIDNFEVSVNARLNFDKSQINETIFDPESKVERSVRSVKENNNSQSSGGKWSVSVEQNIPNEGQGAKPGDQTRKMTDRKEELTNFEVNSKTVATTSDTYKIDHLAVAVVLNRKRLMASSAASTPEAINAQIKEVEQLVASSAGLDTKRGDKITVAAVDFFQNGQALEPIPAPGLIDTLLTQSGSLISSLALLIATIMIIWLGFRPAVKMILDNSDKPQLAATVSLPVADATLKSVESKAVAIRTEEDVEREAALATAHAREVLSQKQLEEVVVNNEEQAAIVIKEWIRGT